MFRKQGFSTSFAPYTDTLDSLSRGSGDEGRSFSYVPHSPLQRRVVVIITKTWIKFLALSFPCHQRCKGNNDNQL